MYPIYYYIKKHISVHVDRRYKYLVRQNSVSTQRPSIETLKFNGWNNENPIINPTEVTGPLDPLLLAQLMGQLQDFLS
jgi:hypothetical protein